MTEGEICKGWAGKAMMSNFSFAICSGAWMDLPLMVTIHVRMAPRALCNFLALFIRAALSVLPCGEAELSEWQGDRELTEDECPDRLKTFVLCAYHY